MVVKSNKENSISLADAPAIPGLAFRHFRGDEDYPALDIRVDDHAEPIAELRRLLEVSLDRFQPFAACLPRRGDPVGELDRTRIEARIEAFQRERRTHS